MVSEKVLDVCSEGLGDSEGCELCENIYYDLAIGKCHV